jgi:hypothetical protein
LKINGIPFLSEVPNYLKEDISISMPSLSGIKKNLMAFSYVLNLDKNKRNKCETFLCPKTLESFPHGSLGVRG